MIDRVFTMMSEDPDMGPRLRDADTPQRFEFTDLELVLNVRAGRSLADGGDNLVWEWSDDVAWKPLRCACRCPRRPPTATSRARRTSRWPIARRRIKTGGDVRAALELIPITKPIHERYRAFLGAEHPHLLA